VNRKTAAITLIVVFFGTLFVYQGKIAKKYGAPPYEDEIEKVLGFEYPLNWQRPDGPIKIGLQAGHWKTEEMPDEQARIRESGQGTSSQGVAEWEVVLTIAKKTAELLVKQGYEVDILPATIPKNYWADAFVSIHADGNLNPMTSGFKIAASGRDRTGKADDLTDFIHDSYKEISNFGIDPNITRNMTRYYAFNSRRYTHAIHPMTPGVIVETGFLTNPHEASVLINHPEIPAKGIAEGIIDFINETIPTN
jgi:hypothetical protein